MRHQDILNGWGSLPEDMKRLELFRPDRLSAARRRAVVEIRSNDTRLRLSQLRQYAGTSNVSPR
jgi:hypothetical protein